MLQATRETKVREGDCDKRDAAMIKSLSMIQASKLLSLSKMLSSGGISFTDHVTLPPTDAKQIKR